MLVVRSKQELNEHLAEWRQHGDHIALVPTMGNLHAGHMSLVDLASEHAERIVVSVFVNPTQFSNGEDFDQYPRTLERDTRRLKNLPADLVFAPDVETPWWWPVYQDSETPTHEPVRLQASVGERLDLRRR